MTIRRGQTANCNTRRIPKLKAESNKQELESCRTADLFEQSYLRDFQLLDFEYENIKPVENIGRQFCNKREEQEDVEEKAGLQTGFAQSAVRKKKPQS